MSGWIYCITNSLYKMDDVYKLGYTANKKTQELVKQHLIQRYGTYFPDVECIELCKVNKPIQAEKQLFELLKDYKYSNEIYKADYITEIKPKLETIREQFCYNNDLQIITEQEKIKYKNKLLKKINNFIKQLDKIQTYLQTSMHKFSQKNSGIISNMYNCLVYYSSNRTPNNKKITISNLTSYIQQFDYADAEILILIDYIQ